MSAQLSPKHLARAFRSRNYRLFYGGQLLSLVGTWMSQIATSWLIYRLTSSAFLLGAVGFAAQFPSAVLAPWAGVQVDRMNRHRVLIVTQTAAMIQSFTLAALTLSGWITTGELLLLCAVQGAINAFDIPARQAFLSEMIVDRADLPNAIALNAAMFNGARLVGPAIGGLLISLTSEGTCFLIDGFSYVAVIYALYLMDVPARSIPPRTTNAWQDLVGGVRYVLASTAVRSLLMLVAATSLLGTAYIVLLPVYAKEIFAGGPEALGALMAASGCGALLGAITLAMRGSIIGLGRIIGSCGMALGVSIALFAYSTSFHLSLFLLFVAGFSMITLMAASNTIIQTLVDDNYRGRVMSFYAMAFTGMAPIGSLVGGSLAHRLGAQPAVCAGGICCVLAAAYFFRRLPDIRSDARPILVARGILSPE
ncbi:MAG: MFS transporter [Bdellovibrionota bacterium]